MKFSKRNSYLMFLWVKHLPKVAFGAFCNFDQLTPLHNLSIRRNQIVSHLQLALAFRICENRSELGRRYRLRLIGAIVSTFVVPRKIIDLFPSRTLQDRGLYAKLIGTVSTPASIPYQKFQNSSFPKLLKLNLSLADKRTYRTMAF
jgi:hypothetical protein